MSRERIEVRELMIDTNPITLTRRILEDQRNLPEARGDFTIILSSIQMACKFLSNAVRKAGINKLMKPLRKYSSEDQMQMKLNEQANEIFINSLKFSTKIAALASEEEENVYVVSNAEDPKYVVAFDPLDGKTGGEANISVGSIFAIWKRANATEPGSAEDFLGNKGQSIVAAGYCLYGGSTQLVLALYGRVDGYTLDTSLGEFILTHPSIHIPRRGSIYSINEGNSADWSPEVTEYIRRRKHPEVGKPPSSLRYVGSLVADIHRTILYGGIFMYPADSRHPEGKLRVLYEAFPMSFVIEQAGGKATDGKKRILDTEVLNLHMRVPLILGSFDDVGELEALHH
mmetsp:Transcript_31243/g.54266  ORF Transcript_31243/g.54266 Transcript_31243/m.54266 type:complete len:343 (+) Transcript_31243:601-1629(+)